MLEFDEVVAPLGQATFLREHWLKTFLHIRGTRGRFAGLLTWNDLSAILEQHRLTPPRLKLFQDGRAVDPSRYLTSAAFGVPRIDAGGLAVCIARGATLNPSSLHCTRMPTSICTRAGMARMHSICTGTPRKLWCCS